MVSNGNNFISENNESIGVLILRFSGIEIDVICKADDSLLFLLLLHESNRKKSKEYKRTFVFMELVGLIKSNNHYAGCIVTATLAIITIRGFRKAVGLAKETIFWP